MPKKRAKKKRRMSGDFETSFERGEDKAIGHDSSASARRKIFG